MRINAEDWETIVGGEPAVPPHFPDTCALCRLDYSGLKRVKSPGGIIGLPAEDGGGDRWLCTQCLRRVGVRGE